MLCLVSCSSKAFPNYPETHSVTHHLQVVVAGQSKMEYPYLSGSKCGESILPVLLNNFYCISYLFLAII